MYLSLSLSLSLSQNPDTLCAALSFCSSKKALVATAATVSSPKNEIECEACKIVVGYLDQQLEKNATEVNLYMYSIASLNGHSV